MSSQSRSCHHRGRIQGIAITLLILLIGGCQSRPYSHVQISKSYPAAGCQEIGQVIGNANTRDGAREQAHEDLRYHAAQLEGNYVRLVAETASGSSARGIAYRCR